MTDVSVQPGTARPHTVMVGELLSGALYVQAWPDGPAALLVGDDATALRTALDRAFAGTAVIEPVKPPLSA